jgi:hypothetical protein
MKEVIKMAKKKYDSDRMAEIRSELFEERVNDTFSKIIREELSQKEFWLWVQKWMDGDEMVKRAEAWNTNAKVRWLKEFKKNPKLMSVLRWVK